MTTKRSIITATVIGAASAATVISVATAGGAAAGTPSSGTFTVRAHHVSESAIDLGRHGYSAGDQDLGVDRLVRKHHRVGWLAVSCTTVRVGRSGSDQLCDFVLHLNGAQLTASGAVRAGRKGPGTFTVPILGGTGRYRGVSGEIAITASNGPVLPITVSLDR